MAKRIEIDTAEWQVLRTRMHERRWLLAASAIVVWGLLLTYKAKTRAFDDVNQQLRTAEEAGNADEVNTLAARIAPLGRAESEAQQAHAAALGRVLGGRLLGRFLG